MTDWMDDKATQDKARQEEAEKRLMVGRAAVDQLEAIVRRDIEKWNASFRQKIDNLSKSMPSGAFKVRKTSFPSATADVFLSSDSSIIEIETARWRAGSNEPKTTKNRFYLKPVVNGVVALGTESGEAISLEAVSRVLLEAMMEGTTAAPAGPRES